MITFHIDNPEAPFLLAQYMVNKPQMVNAGSAPKKETAPSDKEG